MYEIKMRRKDIPEVGTGEHVGAGVGVPPTPRMSSRAKSPENDDPDVYLEREDGGQGAVGGGDDHSSHAIKPGWW